MVDEGRCHAHQSSSVDSNYSSLIILAFHYLSTPIQNEELLRKLYIEMDLSSYQIAEVSGWSRTRTSDALRILDLSKETKKHQISNLGKNLLLVNVFLIRKNKKLLIRLQPCAIKVYHSGPSQII